MTERPPTIQERKDLVIANAEAERKEKAASRPPFEGSGSSDFPWIKLPNWEKPTQPYGGGFLLHLARHLQAWPHNEVERNLHVWFPECDNLDCDYLEEVVEELRRQGIWTKDRPMFVNIPGSGKRFVANVSKVNKWVKNQRLILNKAEEAQNNPITATMPFNGPVSSLALALYILERGGVISLLAYRKNKGNMAALCRTLCDVFPPQNTSSKAPSLALELALSKIPNKKLGVGELDIFVFTALGKKNLYQDINTIENGSSNIEVSLPIGLLPNALIPS